MKALSIIVKYESQVVKSNLDYVKVFSPYMIEIKGNYYSVSTFSHHTFKSSGKDSNHQEFNDNPDSSAVDHQYQQVEDIESVSVVVS